VLYFEWEKMRRNRENNSTAEGERNGSILAA
jgi:hypothetical protein